MGSEMCIRDSQMERQTEESSARDFRERVLAADAEAQKNVAPFLENPVLRRIIKTFTNDERGDFAKWACNPRGWRCCVARRKPWTRAN